MTPDLDWIKGRLDELGLTRAALAEAIGRTPAIATRLLAGRAPFKTLHVAPLAELLQVTQEEIVTRLGVDASPGSPAARVIRICGGILNTAQMAGLHRTAVGKWLAPREKGGTGGLVPAQHQQTLLTEARKRGLSLSPEHFFWDP